MVLTMGSTLVRLFSGVVNLLQELVDILIVGDSAMKDGDGFQWFYGSAQESVEVAGLIGFRRRGGSG